MAKQRIDFVTPVGRIVGGDPFKPSTTDRDNKPRVIKTGPNAGQPNPQIFINLAFPKTPGQPVTPMRMAPDLDFEIASGSEVGKLFALIKGAAAAEFPHLFPGGAAGKCTHPAFSYKIADGDGHDDNGRPWADREGRAGHWIITATRNTGPLGMPQVYTQDQATMQLTPVTGGRPRPGDYARIAGDVSGNNNGDKPGVYLNLSMLCMTAEGAEIVMQGGPSATEAFGGSLASGAAVGAFAPAPAAPVAHATAPLAPAPAAPAPVAPVRQMTAAATTTYEAYVAAGWTDEQLIASGYMVA